MGAQGKESATGQHGLFVGYWYRAGNGEVSQCPLPRPTLLYSPHFHLSPYFCSSSVGNTAEQGLWLRDAAVYSTCWHQLVLLQTHRVCLGMDGMQRGDKSFSCSKKMVASDTGTTGRHGRGHWVPFLPITRKYLHPQAPTAYDNTRTGSSRTTLPTVTTARQ